MAMSDTDNKAKYKEMYGMDMPDISERKYIVCCRKFDFISSAALPLSGQISTNSKILAKIIYSVLNRWSYRNYGSMSVMLVERNENGTYDAISR